MVAAAVMTTKATVKRLFLNLGNSEKYIRMSSAVQIPQIYAIVEGKLVVKVTHRSD